MLKWYAILLAGAFLALSALSAFPGCRRGGGWPNQPAAAKLGRPASLRATPGPTSEPAGAATRPGNREVLALINGKPLYMDRLYEILVRSRGMEIARQLISAELVLQAARKRRITITGDDVKHENDVALKEAFGKLPAADQRERMLKQFMDRFKVSPERWALTMRRNAYLAKMAQSRVKISDRELKDEFGRKYGRSVVVRHIQTTSLEAAERIRREAARPGADFAKLAYKYSINASGKRGGLLPPISEKSVGIPPALKRAALAMTTPGELSEPIMSGTTFHILQLEKIIPPKNVRLQDVKDKLLAFLRARQLLLVKQQILRELFRKAKIEFVNPILKAQAKAKEGSQP